MQTRARIETVVVVVAKRPAATVAVPSGAAATGPVATGPGVTATAVATEVATAIEIAAAKRR